MDMMTAMMMSVVNYRDDERHGLSLSGSESEASC